jgi:hypothetical protein
MKFAREKMTTQFQFQTKLGLDKRTGGFEKPC